MQQYEWGTEAWCKQILSMATQASEGRPPARPEISYKAQYFVTDTPRGTIGLFEEIKEGRLVRMFFGEDATPDVTVTLTYTDYRRIFTELKSSHELASYNIKGDVKKIEPAIALRTTEAYKKYKQRIAEMTQWP